MSLVKIIGAPPTIGSDGVVTFMVPRAEQIVLGGIPINPYLNVSAPIVFQPYGGGINAAAAPDFSLVASEINNRDDGHAQARLGYRMSLQSGDR